MYRDQRPDRLSVSSLITSWSSHSDDGIITKHHHHHHHHHRRRPSADHRPSNLERSRQASTCSDRSCEGMTAEETRDLWRCMLELQQRYGCYTSARIDMALETGDDGFDLMPNRFIIDTLNESLVALPDEGRDMLNHYLYPEAGERKTKWKFWKKA